ncbi:MAG TPA: M1 family metallopeptidase [Gemmatimonadaceae bacterium]|nr:M1 family metallopeptidase [Gemmatimonadaceae bacterium]
MKARILIAVAPLLLIALSSNHSLAQATATAPPLSTRAQTGSAARLPERAVRRDIPMTNMIRRAFAAGTRDSTGRPGRSYWQLWTDYKISARLDTARSTVTGREVMTFRNNSDSAMTSVVLRLDQNIFRADAPRVPPRIEDVTPGMIVSRLVVNGRPLAVNDTLGDSIPNSRRRTTPLSSVLRETSARIRLPAPIPPHASGTIEADWSFKVPRFEGRGYRMGRWADSLYQVAQWYPRLAVFDDLRGWDTDPYLGDGEFYNNFGHFDVSIDVPAGWIVGATGVLQNPGDVLTPTARERLSHVLDSDSTVRVVTAAERGPGKATAAGTNGRLVWHFVADSVADFAWATANQFVWDAGHASIPTRGAVPFNVMYLPGHTQTFAEGPHVVRHALEYYSKLWMPYTFPQLTMVDGPELGMEYPMFIMSAVFAADHEVGHEWWPMMVGVNETWYGWMDEGFNQYMNILSDADIVGKPYTLDSLGMSYGAISGNEEEPPLMWDGNYAGPMYGFQAYGKAPLMLSALGGVVGDTAVWRAMSEYAQAWRFKHPSPWDYAFFMNNALRQDLGWFWNYWLFTTERVDESIQNVRTAGGRTSVTVRQDGEMPSPVILKVEFGPGNAVIRPMANSKMIDANTAIVTYPVDVWFAGSRTFVANLDFGSRAVAKITLDPNDRFPDRNAADNVWPRSQPAPKTPAGN